MLLKSSFLRTAIYTNFDRQDNHIRTRVTMPIDRQKYPVCLQSVYLCDPDLGSIRCVRLWVSRWFYPSNYLYTKKGTISLSTKAQYSRAHALNSCIPQLQQAHGRQPKVKYSVSKYHW